MEIWSLQIQQSMIIEEAGVTAVTAAPAVVGGMDPLPGAFVVVATTTTLLCRGCHNDDIQVRDGGAARAVHSMTRRAWPAASGFSDLPTYPGGKVAQGGKIAGYLPVCSAMPLRRYSHDLDPGPGTEDHAPAGQAVQG